MFQMIVYVLLSNVTRVTESFVEIITWKSIAIENGSFTKFSPFFITDFSSPIFVEKREAASGKIAIDLRFNIKYTSVSKLLTKTNVVRLNSLYCTFSFEEEKRPSAHRECQFVEIDLFAIAYLYAISPRLRD